MGGHKNKRRNNNHSSNKGNNSNTYHDNIQLTEQEQQLLIAQCLHIHTFLENNLKDTKEEQFCHLLSRKWLDNWKTFVGYAVIVGKNEELKMPKTVGKKHPGKINQNMRKITKDFIQVPEQMKQYQYLNTVLNDKLDKGDDYLPAGSKLWQVLLQKYEVAQDIIRPVRKNTTSFFYDSELISCDIMFINHKEMDTILEKHQKFTKKEKQTLIDSNKMQFSTLWSLKDLYKFMVQYVQKTFQGKQEIKIWKVYNYLSFKDLQAKVAESIQQKSYLLEAVPLQGQKFNELDIDQFLRTYYTLLVEVNGSRFIKSEPASQKIKGYCQQCVKDKNLTFRCSCNQAFYCSMECRADDQPFHFKFCPQTFESDDDQQYQKKKVKLGNDFICSGLQNLGNTCYMNSSLQTILSMDQFRDFYGSNQYEQHQKEQDKKQLFGKKFSKFCKKSAEGKEAHQPWSLKGQINYHMAPFRGYKQHDANDFITNFLNLANQFLKVNGQVSMYHPIIKDYLVGQFDSKIACPQCPNKVQNIQIFMQLTLPIKQSGKRLFYTYVISRKSGLTKGKAQVQESWPALLANLNIANKHTPIFSTRQADPLIFVNCEQHTPQKQIRGLKGKQLIFFPEEVLNEGEVPFSFVQVTAKVMCGNQMKSHVGYAYLIKIDPRIMTIVGFWIQIARRFGHKGLAEILAGLQQDWKDLNKSRQKDNQQQTTNTSSNEAQSQGQTNTEYSDINEDSQQRDKELQEALRKISQAFKQTLKQNKIRVFMQDTHRSRGVCSFCKKKCSFCQLPVIFDQSVQQYFGQKLHEVRFQFQLKSRLEPQIQTLNLAQSGDSTLQDCLQMFKMPQQLDQENAWWCSQCDMMRLAEKELNIKSLPKLLLIQLSRFKAQGDRKVKNSEPIQYGEIQIFQGVKYRLLSVIVHEGTMQNGHYWAICWRAGRYFIYNDQKVVETDKVCNKNAYMLLYRRME